MRVALLQADWVNPEFIGIHGDLKDMVGGVLARHSAAPTTLEVFRILEGELPSSAAGYDLLLVPGSRFSAYADFPGKESLVELLREGRERGSRILGLCFGAQLITVAFGGTVGPSEFGWNVGLKPAALARRPEWLPAAESRMTVLFNHRDRIQSLPAGFELILSSAQCPIAGFHYRKQIVGLQFHPEYTIAYQEALMSVSKTLSSEDHEDALERNRLLYKTDSDFTGHLLEHFRRAA
jgi:GMP synthase-like glutamine amidotransferase